jgi:hypothetical protein
MPEPKPPSPKGRLDYIANDPVVFVEVPFSQSALQLEGRARDRFLKELVETSYQSAVDLWNKHQQGITAGRARRQEARQAPELDGA